MESKKINVSPGHLRSFSRIVNELAKKTIEESEKEEILLISVCKHMYKRITAR